MTRITVIPDFMVNALNHIGHILFLFQDEPPCFVGKSAWGFFRAIMAAFFYYK
jgi:hypothetical protein